MPSIARIKTSDGTKNASVATVTTTRSPGATTIAVDTVDGIPPDFCATMGTPHTFTDPVTGETITIISEATAVDFEGHVNSTNLEIDTIAPGYTDAGSSTGDIVVIKPTTQWADNVAAVLGAQHNDDGTHGSAAAVSIGQLLYPVGSLYFNATDATNPGTLLGFGTWVAFGAGRVPVGKAASGTFQTAGATGGEETHTLSVAEMPAHSHAFNQQIGQRNNLGFSGTGLNPYSADQAGLATTNTGGGGAHNNLQPYIVVYIWQRTS